MLARRWLVNLALLVLLALLLLLVQLDQRATERAARLTSIAPADISRLELHRAGEPMIRLQRGEDGWQMRAPFAVAADHEAVARLLPLAGAPVSRTLPAAGLDLAELGLDPAPLRIVLDGLELRFGGTEPVAALRYVQVGDLVHLIDDRFLPRLMTPTIDLVSRRLLPAAFSPGLGDLDGTPVTADTLAPLAEAVAVRVETAAGHLDEALGAGLLSIASADGGDGVEFMVSDGGTRWTRLDAPLSWLFATAPLDLVRNLPATTGRSSSPRPVSPAAPAGSLSVMPAPASEPAAGPAESRPAPDTAMPGVAVQTGPVLPVRHLTPPAPGTEPTEERPTAAIPNLRDMVPTRTPDPTALPQGNVDPFAPDAQGVTGQTSAPAVPNAADPAMPLPTEKLRP
jgi:hypothetical protein